MHLDEVPNKIRIGDCLIHRVDPEPGWHGEEHDLP